MKTVISISLGASSQDFSFTATVQGRRLRVQRLGCDGSVARARALLQEWDGRAAAIGLGVMPASGPLRVQSLGPERVARLLAVPRTSPVTTGLRLRDMLLEWAVRQAQVQQGRCFDNARVLFFSGQAQHKLALALHERTPNLAFADPLLQLGVPKLLMGLDALHLYTTGAHYVAGWKPPRVVPVALQRRWTRHVLTRAMAKATVVVAPVHELDGFGLEALAGKTIITTQVSDERLARFKDAGVALVVDGSPIYKGHVLGPELLEAMIAAACDKPPAELLEDDILQTIGDLGMLPRILLPGGSAPTNRFAFVIHPLSQEYFKKVKAIDVLSRVSPPLLMDSLEKVMAYAPPFVYSKVEGIVSPTGVQAEGWLISVGGTPREILRHSPEFTYRRLLAAAEMARKLGAQIMGLGAFTKVVGDAGVTVAKRAPLPITTGNSYSASGALWAAHDALLRLNLLPRPQGKGRVPFKAMVVGATGAIGSACARLLVRAAEEVTLVSPETAKLLALKASILQQTPDARVVLSARADTHIAEMDMIVTATSGAGQKVLDILQVKPGCVITDVARPLDLPPSEVAKRPDVLVIESGEILLPGDVKMKNIGLPPGVAYACLAETIVLALEGRFENYTVGRAIEWEKVREIYQLGLKHGMRLAAISGVNGVYSDEDIARVRERALVARAQAAQPGPGRWAGRAGRAAQGAPATQAAQALQATEAAQGVQAGKSTKTTRAAQAARLAKPAEPAEPAEPAKPGSRARRAKPAKPAETSQTSQADGPPAVAARPRRATEAKA